MKVLLVAPSGAEVLGVIGRSVARALTRLGHEVELFDYRRGFLMAGGASSRPGEPGGRGGVGGALRDKVRKLLPFSPRSLPGVRTLESRKMARALLDVCGSFGPDVILVLKGEGLDAGLMRDAKSASGAVIVNWFQDSVTLPELREIAVSVSGGYDFFFGVDDLDVLGRAGLQAGRVGFLPMGFDPEIYNRAEFSPGELDRYGSDVAFVGTMVPARVAAFERMTLPGLKIWGPPVTAYGPWLREGSPLAACYTGVAPLGAEAAKVYRASAITLGMHCLFGVGKAANVTPRVFEVPASGGFLLTDAHPQVGLFYDTESEMATYRDMGELREQVDYYLANQSERAEMVSRASERAHAEHTYDMRLREMLRVTGAAG